MTIYLDPHDDSPVYRQLHDQILVAIACGELKPGDKLDSVRGVAANFGINPATVKKAYDLLQADGVVETKGRSGTVVCAPSGADLSAEIEHLVARASASGVAPAQLYAAIDEAYLQLEVQK